MAGDQPRLPGWCWTCNGRGVVLVTVTVRGDDGGPDCRAWWTSCPDCTVPPARRQWAEAVRCLMLDADQD